MQQPAAVMAPPAVATTTAPETEEAAYDRISKRFATVLKSADEEAQKLIDQARAEATKLLDDARAEADRIRVDAQANAEQARSMSAAELAKAREEADRVLGGLEQRVLVLQRELLLVGRHLQEVHAIERPAVGARHAHDLLACLGQRDVHAHLAATVALQQELQAHGGLTRAGIALDQVQPIPGQPTAKDIVEPFNSRPGEIG
jgi:vacuolar-type H+-ATPase subunit H